MVFLIKNAVFPGVPLALNQRSHFSTMVRGTPLFFFFFFRPSVPSQVSLADPLSEPFGPRIPEAEGYTEACESH